MKCYNKAIGSYGEDLASNHLIINNYKIITRNFRCRCGEIDIICCKNDILVFCEVKSRYTDSYGSPVESVTCSKQKQIIKLSNMYINYKKLFNYNIRYDIIEVIFNHKTSHAAINHVKDAFRTY